MRSRDQNISAREGRQQLTAQRRSGGWVGVEDHCELGMRQLNTLRVDDIAAKQDGLTLGRKFIAGMSRGMTRKRDNLHAVDDGLGATKRVPLAGRDIWRCDGLRTLEERLRILGCPGGDFR